jgi:hypothetical protein
MEGRKEEGREGVSGEGERKEKKELIGDKYMKTIFTTTILLLYTIYIV